MLYTHVDWDAGLLELRDKTSLDIAISIIIIVFVMSVDDLYLFFSEIRCLISSYDYSIRQ